MVNNDMLLFPQSMKNHQKKYILMKTAPAVRIITFKTDLFAVLYAKSTVLHRHSFMTCLCSLKLSTFWRLTCLSGSPP